MGLARVVARTCMRERLAVAEAVALGGVADVGHHPQPTVVHHHQRLTLRRRPCAARGRVERVVISAPSAFAPRSLFLVVAGGGGVAWLEEATVEVHQLDEVGQLELRARQAHAWGAVCGDVEQRLTERGRNRCFADRTWSVGSLLMLANISRSNDGEHGAPTACSNARISSSSTEPEPSRSSALNQPTSCRSSAAGSSQSAPRGGEGAGQAGDGGAGILSQL